MTVLRKKKLRKKAIEYRKTSQREFDRGEDQLKQKHTAARRTSLTEGQEDYRDPESEQGDQRLQRVDA